MCVQMQEGAAMTNFSTNQRTIPGDRSRSSTHPPSMFRPAAAAKFASPVINEVAGGIHDSRQGNAAADGVGLVLQFQTKEQTSRPP